VDAGAGRRCSFRVQSNFTATEGGLLDSMLAIRFGDSRLLSRPLPGFPGTVPNILIERERKSAVTDRPHPHRRT